MFTGTLRSAASLSHQVLSFRWASTALRMPAMSPTMTEGGIASWKKNEGDAFAQGDVLLEIETDKATIDVEAQDDGVMGKILAKDGSQKVPVGQIIAMLAEEGDDLASIEVPSELGPESSSGPSSSSSSGPKKEEKKTEPAPASSGTASGGSGSHGHKDIHHAQPLFPSVQRLLQESSLSTEEISKLKGTGKRGMLTKGDVLLALGKIDNPYGSAKDLTLDVMGPSGKRASENKATAPQTDAKSGKSEEAPKPKAAPLTGSDLRRLIVAGMNKATQPAKPIVPHGETPLPRSLDADFDSILAPYASLLPPPQPSVSLPIPVPEGQFVQKNEYAGLM